ncbi:MAG: hypothetical protein A2452_13240 [Candidatus Firestonebacteria bacterium RIFOXYC2_FULL_39_67]|nr:MAG: hypothetical protein A2536_03125 [Candidatus Firestonebacteria bacterium RIFOXYD2_FULL_39_29]OGF56284.1 MAG: hypothetical protein A2452_13240 [Candidatus Firestonebacteria bacterium RIFOXYC2_FULL_39_67]
MFKKISVLLVSVAIAVVGCSKVIKPADKPMYDRAVAAIDNAKAEIKLSEKAPTLKDLYEMFNSAKSYLSTAEEWLEKGQYSKSIDLANKAGDSAKNVRELPGQIQGIIAEAERSLQLAKEVGMDKTYGKMIKEVTNYIWDAKNNIRLKNYELAKSFASQALASINKANKDVEKATDELTKAKTALAEAKDSNADTLVPDMYKNVEEAIKTATDAMDKANFVQAAESAAKASQLAKDALVKAKEEAVKQQNQPETAPVPKTNSVPENTTPVPAAEPATPAPAE